MTCHSILAMKKTSLLRSFLWVAPAALAYLVVMPMAALWLDRHLALVNVFPTWTWILAVVLIPSGLTLALWCVWLFAKKGEGTPNPLSPPSQMVLQGPYRRTRNPMMLGAWLAGGGLAFALRSPSLLIAILFLVAVGALYVGSIEEPRLLARYGKPYRDYLRSVPRWMWICSLLCVFCLPSLSAQNKQTEQLVPKAEPVPTVIVQIKFKPGVGDQWIEAFEKQIVPAIQEAVDKRDQITGCAYFENVVAGQPYDFVLIMQAKSFAFFDRRQEFPHYRALFHRLGPEKAEKLLADMDSWEEDVQITLV